MIVDKWTKWYDSLPEHTRKYLESQPIWKDSDLIRIGIIAGVIGFAIGVVVGFEWAWRPVVNCFKPLTG